MSDVAGRSHRQATPLLIKWIASGSRLWKKFWEEKNDRIRHPFNVIMDKEVSDHVRSWRFIILIAIIVLTCLGSMYTTLTNIGNAVKADDPEGAFFFLKLFTVSDGTLPSFFVFISFLTVIRDRSRI